MPSILEGVLEKGIKRFDVETKMYKVSLLNIGASLFKLSTPDKNGKFEEILLGHKSPIDYFKNSTYQGVVVGRSSGRIDNAEFKIDDQLFKVPANNATNNLHSSGSGVSRRSWETKIEDNKLIFSIKLLETYDGFPGDITIVATYTFNKTYIKLDFKAKSTKDTVCNLTNHSYFNLSGNFKHSVLEHTIENTFTNVYELDANSIPKVPILSKEVFKDGNEVKELIDNNKKLFESTRGLDNPFELDKSRKVKVSDKTSGRSLEVITSYPYAVIYSQNWEDKELNNELHKGLAVECQYIPNDINSKSPKTLLRKGEEYLEWTEFHFNR